MKRLLITSLVLNVLLLCGYITFVVNSDIIHTKPTSKQGMQLWSETRSLYKTLPNDSAEIIFLGTSITYGCEWAELFDNCRIKNRGVGGEDTEAIYQRLAEVTESKPEKIFIEAGTNDLALGASINQICLNYRKIVDYIHATTPTTDVYIQSVLPVKNRPERNNDSICRLNERLQMVAKEEKTTYIDLHQHYINKRGELDSRFSFDGLHLNGDGYALWKDLLKDYLH